MGGGKGYQDVDGRGAEIELSQGPLPFPWVHKTCILGHLVPGSLGRLTAPQSGGETVYQHPDLAGRGFGRVFSALYSVRTSCIF